MAKKTAKKAKQAAKKSAKKSVKKSVKKKLAKEKLATTKSARKLVKKPAKKSTKKAAKNAASKANPAKGAATRAAKGRAQKAAAKSRVSPTSGKTATTPVAEDEASAEAIRSTEKPVKESTKPLPKETGRGVIDKPPAHPKPAAKPAPEPHLFANLLARVHAVCRTLGEESGWSADVDLSRVVVEPPRDTAHGDMATNAAMVLARDAKAKPRDLAEQIAAKLRADDLIASVDVAGPGFINLTLKASVWSDALRIVLREGDSYGRSAIGAAEKVNVEYVSANPTGPMHVGHCRGAVFGDALCSLLQFASYDVTREYYINDAGAQVDVLARSAYLRYREALGEDIGAIPEGLYPGDYLVPVGQALAAEYGNKLKAMPEYAWLPIVRLKAIDMMMAMIKGDLAALHIKHDVFFSERSLIETGNNRVAETIDYLRSKGDVYEGRLPPPKGGPIEDYEDREQTLFRATAFGDDIDRPLIKSDGSYTYFASDIAYHKDKFERGFTEMIDVFGADHGGYVKRMKAAVKAVTDDRGHLDVKLVERLDVKVVQLVRLLRNGEPVKMSKRSGDFVTLRDVVDEVGKDAVRFMMLYRTNDAALEFDLSRVIEQSKDNPVFYVQYAHARAKSVLRQGLATIPGLDISSEALIRADLGLLEDEGEISLIKRLAHFPRIVEAAALSHEPHRIAFYLH